jgi:hypothetical protein
MLKLFFTVILVLLSVAAFYYSLFWGWASGTGTVDQPYLKSASNVALAVSFVAFLASVALWLRIFKKRRKQSVTETASVK